MADYVLQNWCSMNESTILVKSPHPKLSFVATNSHADFHYKLIKIKTELKKHYKACSSATMGPWVKFCYKIDPH